MAKKIAPGGFALACAVLGALPSAFSSPDANAYAYFLPDDIREAAVTEIAKHDYSEAALAARESAAFISEESKTNTRAAVRNRVHFFPGERFDLWFMSQNGGNESPPPMAAWNKLMIVVDKSVSPKKSYYLEFGETELRARELPRPVAFTAACFTCHSSGPRAIRMESTLGPAESTQALATIWNKEIAAYKRVATHFAPEGPYMPSPSIRRTYALANEELKHKACTECHNSVDGVRAPLLRQHLYSILSLTQYGHMPEEGPKLAVAEMRCLENWLKEPGKKLKGCNSFGEAAAVQ